MGNTAPYYLLKNYTQVSGPNLAVIKKVMVILVVKEVVSKSSRRASLPPAGPLCGPVLEASPAAQSTSRAADRRTPDNQVQNGQPGIW